MTRKEDDNRMTESPDILRLRVLLCFLKSAPEHCTVTGISRTLNEEKYTISRSMQGLAKDGLIDRTDARHPLLTEKGRELAQRYAERVEIATNHLLSVRQVLRRFGF
jgi:Mn-dependent DtxR family transcriptional regulator